MRDGFWSLIAVLVSYSCVKSFLRLDRESSALGADLLYCCEPLLHQVSGQIESNKRVQRPGEEVYFLLLLEVSSLCRLIERGLEVPFVLDV